MSLNSAVCTFHNSGYNSKFSIKRHVSSLAQLKFSYYLLQNFRNSLEMFEAN
nr:unnamed protein product [Callosobruchus chinensis]